jgi:hypothetical protein
MCVMTRPMFGALHTLSPTDVAIDTKEDQKAATAAASREAAEREMAYLRALNGPPMPRAELPEIKMPLVSDDFPERFTALDEKILSRGIAIDRQRLQSLGQQRFKDLLEADRTARALQRIMIQDLTSWPSVLQAFQMAGAQVPVKAAKMSEQWAGQGQDREAVRTISNSGFQDLWKLSTGEVETVNKIYAHHDLFASLAFGQSLLDLIGDDDRVHSKFFCHGSGRKVLLFKQWLQAVKDSTHWLNVRLVEPVAFLVCWLANEKRLNFPALEIAKEFFGCRAPTALQLDTVLALWNGFLRDYSGWHLWEFVGRATRTIPDERLLTHWQKLLARSYPGISQFHADLRAAFCKQVSTREGVYQKFEPAKHREYFDAVLQEFSSILSAVTALAVEDQLPGAVIARFDNWIIAEREPKRTLSPASLSGEIAKVFPGGYIQLEVTQ